jgi:hypothetical protein
MRSLKNLDLTYLWLCLLILLTVIPERVSAEEASTVPIYIQQEKQQWSVQPFIEQGSTMVPMRALFEKLGFTVDWDGEKQAATATKGDLAITLSINKGTAVVNQTVYFLEVSPLIRDDSTFMPLRFVSEAAGADVTWDETERSVQITMDPTPQKRIRKLIENVTHSSSFTQTIVSITGGDGITRNDMVIKDIVMSSDGAAAKVKFEAGFTVSKAVKTDQGITISPVESVVYEFTCDLFKDSFDQWLMQTPLAGLSYELKQKRPFVGAE